MLRLFVSLYLLLVAAITAFILGQLFLVDILQKDFARRVLEGPVHLLRKELAEKPIEAWPGYIRGLEPYHGYPIAIQRPEETGLTKAELHRLRQGKVVVSEVDGAEYWYLLLDNSAYVLSVGIEPTRSELARRNSTLMFHLTMRELKGHPKESWPFIIEELQEVFSFPVALIRMDNSELTETELDRLRQGETLGFDLEESTDVYYKRIKDTPFVLKLGPLPARFSNRVLSYIILGILATIIAIVVLLWVRPLWRGMTQLDQVTAAFGRGEFDARIKVPRRSALSTLASTFNGMAERIQRLIASHKELTNAVSHELRTPIARLRFGIEMLGNARDEATRSRFIASMNADIDELDSLVAELLAYARFDRQSPRLQLERQPLQSWLRDFVEEVQEETSAINLRCKFDPEGEPLSATFEPKLIARAIGNLLRNARRYAEDQVEIRVEINGQDLQICVDDDGPGVPVADRERVFEPFTRLDTSRDRSSGGYGLGLAIVKRIAEWHGGRAFVKDSPLGGASYCLRWPGSAE